VLGFPLLSYGSMIILSLKLKLLKKKAFLLYRYHHLLRFLFFVFVVVNRNCYGLSIVIMVCVRLVVGRRKRSI